MVRLYYNNHELLSQTVGRPFNRYNQVAFNREQIKNEIKEKLNISNGRDIDGAELHMEKYYEISNVYVNTGSTDQDAEPMTWVMNGKTPTIIYGDNNFTDPGVTVQNGSVVRTIDKTKLDKNGVPIPGAYKFYYVLKSVLGYERVLWRNIVRLDSPVIIMNGEDTITLERGVDSYVEKGAYVRDGLESINITVPEPIDINVSGTYKVAYTCTRGDISSTVYRNVVVKDTIPPLLTLGGTGLTVLERFGVFTQPTVTASDYDTLVKTKDDVDMLKVGQYEITWLATDADGNKTKKTRGYLVQDTTPPALTLINDTDEYNVIERGSGNYVEQGVTTDGGEAYTITIVDISSGLVVNSIDTSIVNSFTVTYSATDTHGNTGNINRTVRVVDTTPPVITITNDTDEYNILQKGVDSYVEHGAVSDGGELVTIQIFLNGVEQSSISNATEQAYDVRYTSTDTAGNSATKNRTVQVVDTNVPILSFSDNTATQLEKGNFTDINLADLVSGVGGVTVTSNGGETVTATIYDSNGTQLTSDPVIPSNTVGQYSIKYEATDNAAVPNTGFRYRTVSVVDTTPPEITITNDTEQYNVVEKGSTYTDQGASVTGGTLTSTVITNSSGTTVPQINASSPVGNYYVTYTASDSASPPNVSQMIRSVTVRDTTAPTITITGTETIQIEKTGTSQNYSDDGATFGADATSTTTEFINSSSTVIANIDKSVLGEYRVRYKASDIHGNERIKYRYIDVVDTTGPVLTVNGDNTIYLEKGSSYDHTADLGATDTESTGNTISVSVIKTSDNSTVSGGLSGIVTTSIETYKVKYSVVDNSGNEGSVYKTIIIEDTTGPTITINNNTDSYNHVELGSVYNDQGATFGTDAVTTSTTITKNGVATNIVNTSIHNNEFNIVYVATDSAGNTSSETRVVTVKDRTAPILTVEGDNPYELLHAPQSITSAAYNDTTAGGFSVSGTTNPVVITYLDSSLNVVSQINWWERGVGNTPKQWRVRYTATDGVNTTSVDRIVNVVDKTPPSFELEGSGTIIVSQGDTYTDAGIKNITDNDGNFPSQTLLTSTYVPISGKYISPASYGSDSSVRLTVDTSVAHNTDYIYRWSITDDYGNTRVVDRSVQIRDVTVPVLNLPDIADQQLASSGTFNTTSIGVGAGEGGTNASLYQILYQQTPSSTSTQVDGVSLSTGGIYTLYYKQTDAAGNEGTASTTVVVKDMIIPEFTGNTQDLEFEKGSTGVSIIPPSVSAPSYIGTTTLYDVNNNVVTGGQIDASTVTTYKIKYTAVSGFGNTTEFIRTVNIVDTSPPAITFNPQSISVEEGNELDLTNGVTVDGQGWDQWNNYTTQAVDFDSGGLNLNQVGTYTVTYTANDQYGNSATKPRTVTVSEAAATPITSVSGQGQGWDPTTESQSVPRQAGYTDPQPMFWNPETQQYQSTPPPGWG